MPRDPVCNSEVNKEDSESVEFDGIKYYFCCDACKELFKETPRKYVNCCEEK